MQALTDEAKAILREAANGDGTIMSGESLAGPFIEANGKSLIPDEEPRTAAQWKGGLKDLQQRGYVRVRSIKGGIFEVTREGYKVADGI